MLTTTALATEAPILLAPAMESRMWTHPLTQENLARLRDACDLVVVGPAEGRLASGARGWGRMAEPDVIYDAIRWTLGRKGPMADQRIVVTAGGTREPLDPIRFIGNRSSGQMGYALAHEARDRGAHVTLISTTGQFAPFGVDLVPVDTAIQMHDAVVEALADANLLLMAAAVADYRPTTRSDEKIKKTEAGLSLDLIRTPDILTQVAKLRRPSQLVVGFAAETQNLLEHATEKLQRKNLDLIVANDARQAMGSATNQVTLVFADGRVEELPVLPKSEVASRILDRVMNLHNRGERQITIS
jgi:phosphopantothenoylcysteine decarboxylase/phosphopantothenate--cysteine ligase